MIYATKILKKIDYSQKETIKYINIGKNNVSLQ